MPGIGPTVGDAIEKGTQHSQSTVPVPNLGSGSGWSLFAGFIELVLVIGLVAVVVYLLIKFLSLRSNSGKTNPFMRTISVHPLATNRTIQMVMLEDRVYVIGVGEDITLLDVIQDKAVIERIQEQSPKPITRDLPEWLTKWLPIQNRKAEAEEVAPEFHETLQAKLQQMKDQRKKIQEWDTDEK